MLLLCAVVVSRWLCLASVVATYLVCCCCCCCCSLLLCLALAAVSVVVAVAVAVVVFGAYYVVGVFFCFVFPVVVAVVAVSPHVTQSIKSTTQPPPDKLMWQIDLSGSKVVVESALLELRIILPVRSV